jgi:hypothetical protein
MKKFTVKKVDPSVVKGHPYSYELEYGTWRELVKDMHHRDKYQNSIFFSGGADVFENDVKIGNIRTFYYNFEKPINKVGLTEFKNVGTILG